MLKKNNKKLQSENNSTGKFSYSWLVYLLLILFLLFPSILKYNSNAKEISWHQFNQDMLKKNAVQKLIVINNEKVNVYIKSQHIDDPYQKNILRQRYGKLSENGPQYWFSIGSVEIFQNLLNDAQKNTPEENRVDVRYEKSSFSFWGLLGWILPLILLVGFWNFFIRRTSMAGNSGNAIFNFGKSNATIIENEKTNTTFEDVAGLEEAEAEVKEIVDFLKKPDQYTRIGAKIPKGVILVGPPGTGKTLLAKAVAGEAGVPFFTISGSAFVEMFVGVGASRVRDLFKSAKERAPCIVFIDEIDAIGRSRGRGAFMNSSNDERESTLNQLLTEMDGFETNSGVIVLAATNRADMLDPALLRPGRFDRHIYLELPNLNEREAIFKVHIKNLVMEDNIDIKSLASQTPGFSGADIANVCNEAALISARNKKDKIGKLEFIDAIERIVSGLEKKSRIISKKEKTIIAYHEAGHAVASWLLKRVDPLLKVSVIPRGKSLGAAWYLPEEKNIQGEKTFSEQLCAALAGRVAEDIIFEEVSSGSLDDLEKATKEAYTMIVYYGFSKKIGNVSYYDSTCQTETALQKPFSEETGKLIDEEVRNLINDSYKRTKDLLIENKQKLDEVATELLKKETLYKEDLERILGKRVVEDKNIILNHGALSNVEINHFAMNYL